MTPFDLIREVAHTFGQEPTDQMCEVILWSETILPINKTNSNDELEIEFFESGKEPGQRLDEEIDQLKKEGKWLTHINDPYCTPEMVRLRTQRCASVCIDEECNLSGGYAHVGPCEPCTCGMEHAIAECPKRPESIIGFDYSTLEDKLF